MCVVPPARGEERDGGGETEAGSADAVEELAVQRERPSRRTGVEVYCSIASRYVFQCLQLAPLARSAVVTQINPQSISALCYVI